MRVVLQLAILFVNVSSWACNLKLGEYTWVQYVWHVVFQLSRLCHYTVSSPDNYFFSFFILDAFFMLQSWEKLKYSIPRLTEMSLMDRWCNMPRLENNLVCKIYSAHVLRSRISQGLLRSIDRLVLEFPCFSL